MRLLLLQVGDAPRGRWQLADGVADPPLSASGLEQAAAAARRLSALSIDAIYRAPSRRAAETAAELADARRGEPIVMEDLAEIHHGSYEGRNFHDLARDSDPAFAEFRTSRSWDAFPDGEGDAAFRHRCRSALDRVVDGAAPDAIRVVVSHGGVLNSIVSQALQLPRSMLYMPRGGSLTCLVFSSTDPVCLVLNDCAHLATDPLTDPADPLLASYSAEPLSRQPARTG
ncbi:MAG TPA: histidine phosphatase family protein [Jatrophihabitans sp.]|nr:histidine phosphatase family protein [Jatrophihabitans sp.]